LVAEVVSEWRDGAGWPTWTFENHDAPRAVSRWATPEHRETLAQMKTLLLCSLRGSIIIYQGEELGLPQADVPFDQLRDPEALANWPQTLSRDGARTPMPWSMNATNLGFSTGSPWLPIGREHGALAVEAQEARPGSTLHVARRCLALRASHSALRHGSMRILEAGEQLLVFERQADGESLRCSFNLSASPAARNAPVGAEIMSVGDVGLDQLGSWSAVVERVGS
jgi:alpha-glucosidase